jgi:hypothetical protein
MFLSLIEWQAEGAAADMPLAPSQALVTRFYKTKGVAENCMIWCEYDKRPHVPDLPQARVTILQQTQDVGQSGPLETPFVYLVHTDIGPELLDEYNAWYGEEHLPRLVKVPGILRARRFTALAGAPLFLTAYDLTDRHAFESPEGLVARKTPWTERMRSHFANTRRIMCML